MNIFITVGTTHFNSLVEAADKCAAELTEHKFTFQTAGSAYKPLHGECFEFGDAIDDYYDRSDIIITHAGAGSIYKLLELRKIVIVVPNLERVDKHQSDIAKFLEENKYALIVWNLEELPAVLQSADIFQPTLFEKNHFFKAEEIASFISS